MTIGSWVLQVLQVLQRCHSCSGLRQGTDGGERPGASGEMRMMRYIRPSKSETSKAGHVSTRRGGEAEGTAGERGSEERDEDVRYVQGN